MGQAPISTMRDLQIEVGTSKPFYELIYKKYEYITQDTQWAYWWKMTREFNINPVIHNFWVPRTNFSNDKNIMEVAIEDLAFQGEGKYKLRSMNKCRLYMRSFYISDLLNNDNITIDSSYLNGEIIRIHPDLKFPSTVKPT